MADKVYLVPSITPSSGTNFTTCSENTTSFTSTIIQPVNLTDVTCEYNLVGEVPPSVFVEVADNSKVTIGWKSAPVGLFTMKLIDYIYDYKRSYCFRWDDLPKGAALTKVLFNPDSSKQIVLEVSFSGNCIEDPNPSTGGNSSSTTPKEVYTEPTATVTGTYYITLTHSKDDDLTRMLQAVNSGETQYLEKLEE